jgi:hypothetical protein
MAHVKAWLAAFFEWWGAPPGKDAEVNFAKRLLKSLVLMAIIGACDRILEGALTAVGLPPVTVPFTDTPVLNAGVGVAELAILVSFVVQVGFDAAEDIKKRWKRLRKI